MPKINLYSIVTNDEYELPVKCDLRAGQAAEFLGTTPGNLRHMVCRPLKKSRYKVIVSGKVKFSQAEYAKRYDMTHDRSEYFRRHWREKRDIKKAEKGNLSGLGTGGGVSGKL